MNRLQHETSPYLLQHAHNPVDWYAWKPEAFERARAEDKPILVSIGYSTCHWCHVMERESFENADIAAFMNERFINIKVDREERPDVDAIYMDACQILTGSGGWPLNCFLTPDGKPFFAGTYYPPRPTHGRPSWLQVLMHLANIWETQRNTALEQAEKLLDYMRRGDDMFVPKMSAPPAESDPFSGFQGAQTLQNIYYKLREQFDRVDGGFGGAPKFPSTMSIQYLLHYFGYTGEQEALDHARLSLDKMIQGGIYDQLGGGFSRYATDREWLVPHFEKMLYDNALLVKVLADAWKLTGNSLYRETLEETLEYIQREMTHPEGGFYSAQDADSEGEEGKFYVWSKNEVDALLGGESALFCAFYDVTESGNWEGHNILWRPSTFEEFAAANQLEVDELKRRLKNCRDALFAVRVKRVPPGLDDKVLLSWNALMISGYAAAYTALGHEGYREQAVRAAAFLLDNMRAADGRLLHVWKDGKAQYEGFLEDYAYLVAALIDLWEITFDPKYLTLAEKYAGDVLSYFRDEATGLFYFTDERQSGLLMRKKDLFDNATPSGNSIMVLNLQRLGLLLDRPEWRGGARNLLLSMRETVERYASSFSQWAIGIVQAVHPPLEIAVVGAGAYRVGVEVQQYFLPNRVVAAAEAPTEKMPLLAGKDGGSPALIYICRNYTCQKPVQSLDDFRAQTDIHAPLS